MPSNWLNHISVCDEVFMFQAAFLCADCAAKIIDELDKTGQEDTGYSKDYPQGPYENGGGESDSPNHCDSGIGCVNAIKVPGGRPIGCPLGNPLTSEGQRYVTQAIADDVLRRDDHARAVGRLWRMIYPEAEPRHLIPIKHESSITSPSNFGQVLDKLNPKLAVPPTMFTDLDYVYGYAHHPRENYLLWRMEITPEGNFDHLETVELPESESRERSLEDAIEEAVRDGAWD
jgi:hypothetical protein